jgi:DNA-binding NarL/FixJ family response regulator
MEWDRRDAYVSASICGHMARTNQHILVLDHEPVWLKALKSTLEDAGLKITTTSSATGALKLLRDRGFAVAMVGIDSDRFDWQRFLERAKLRAPTCKLIVVSHQDPLATVGRALELGADAYVVKRAEPEDLVFAVRQALSPAVYQVTGRPVRLPGRRTTPQQPLTRREEEILHLLAEGCSNAEIATRLSIKEPTVKSHLWRLYRKIGVRSRTAAVAWATASRSSELS